MKSWLLVTALVSASLLARAQDRTQARSMVVSHGGIVASEHPLASQAGAMILARGGHAVDAAIAANAMLGVVAPMMCGVGGDLFVLVYDAKSKRTVGLNASGWTPRSLDAGSLRQLGLQEMPQLGIHTVTVPGAVDGWFTLHQRFGRTSMSKILAPAIVCAEKGHPVAEWVSEYWRGSESKLKQQNECTRVFLPNGHAPRLGEAFANPDLARTYRRIASRGRHGFYEGPIARSILDLSKSLGGHLDAADLQEYRSEWVEPITTDYRGWTIYEIPPNGQGIAALIMLNLMETFPMSELGAGAAQSFHTMIECKKLAYADLLRFVADPRSSKIPVRALLDKSYARERARWIDPGQAMDGPMPGKPFHPGEDTTYLCVVDAEGNMVSFIQSNYSGFGSGLVPNGAGFVLHNRGGLFTLEPGHPNVLAGRKRPLHTIIPAMMAKEDVRIAFGIMGGFNQAQAHAQFVSHIVDHGLNIQAALEAPRFTKLTFPGRDVQIEDRVPQAVRDQLAAKGHQLKVRGSFTSEVGGGQAVMSNSKSGVHYGASDPRKDGAAIPEPWPRK